MTATGTNNAPARAAEPTKAQLVIKLLSRKAGATVDNMTDATGWQPHSARAHLTGLRKKGTVIAREQRKDGTTCWRIVAQEQSTSATPA